MNNINRQKFLAELGKLLTFMFENDRLAALALYNKLFDEAESEQALISLLVSPTRQAVCIARAYNSKGDDPDDPSYARVIENIRQDAIAQRIIHSFGVVPSEQLSIFDAPVAEEAPATDAESVPAPVQTAESEASAPDKAASPDVSSDTGDDSAPEAPHDEAELPAPELGETVAPDEASFVPVPEEHTAELLPEFVLDDGEPTEAEPKRKPRWFLLIVYTLFAIPITIVGLAVMLLPTFVSMAAAGVLGAAGVTVLMAALGSGFSIFADIMLVIGIAVILLAVALLFLWLFIWFIGGAMVGFVNGVISLGRRWCYKEVEAE